MSLESESLREDEVIVHHCQTWLDFMTFIDSSHRTTRGMMYRGQKEESWLVESTLFRETKAQVRYLNPDLTEPEVLRMAAKVSTSYGGMVMQSYQKHLANRKETTLNIKQAWMLGRHEGLLTPFIDWTASPYVAAFFAAVGVIESRSQKSGRNCAIYVMSQWMFPWELSKKTKDNGDLQRHALLLDATDFGNKRAIAQQGYATYTYPQTDMMTFAAETARSELAYRNSFTKITLPHSVAEDALNHLHQMNVNYLTLFPDSIGIAMQANLNLLMHLEGMGYWRVPPGFEGLIPPEQE